MKTITFIINDKDMGSRVFIECKRVKQKVKIAHIVFASGNVVSLNSVRGALSHANNVLP